MSTKSTLSYDKEFHLYQEIFDVSNVYLEVSNTEFAASNNQVMVKIPIKFWRKMLIDWEKRGWPESEDGSEKTISNNWMDNLEFTFSRIK